VAVLQTPVGSASAGSNFSELVFFSQTSTLCPDSLPNSCAAKKPARRKAQRSLKAGAPSSRTWPEPAEAGARERGWAVRYRRHLAGSPPPRPYPLFRSTSSPGGLSFSSDKRRQPSSDKCSGSRHGTPRQGTASSRHGLSGYGSSGYGSSSGHDFSRAAREQQNLGSLSLSFVISRPARRRA